MEYQPDVFTPAAKHSMLAWILFGLTLVGAIGVVLIEEQKQEAASARAAAAAKAEEKARGQLTDAANAKRALETRVQELQAENGRLTVKVASAARLDAAKPTLARAAKKHRKHHKRA
jgi:predicted RNase H-like nuclease (RuvC/YqgF family)